LIILIDYGGQDLNSSNANCNFEEVEKTVVGKALKIRIRFTLMDHYLVDIHWLSGAFGGERLFDFSNLVK
jgi:hypothetical protein